MVALRRNMMSWILVNTGLGNGLNPGGTGPFPEPVRIYPLLDPYEKISVKFYLHQ